MARDYSRAATTGVQQPRDFRPLSKDVSLEDVPKDGSCFYHAIARMLKLSPWHPMHDTILSAQELRTQLAQYFEQNAAKYDIPEYRNIVRIALDATNPQDVSFEAAVPAYAATIRGEQWGGDLEMDMTSEMFGVIIHRFDAYENMTPKEALLVTSFFPDQTVSDGNRTVTKWVLVWHRNHFMYARPSEPRGLGGAAPSGPSGSANPQESDDVRRRAEFLRNRQRNKPPLTTQQQKNRLLAELEQNRRDRRAEARDGDGATCLPSVTLTDEQEAQQASIELVRRLEEQERQIANDRALAHRMSYASLS